MSRYILARGYKKAAYEGFRREIRNGVRVLHKVEVLMEPGKAVETDLDMEHWVTSGAVVRVREQVPVLATEDPEGNPVDAGIEGDDGEGIGDQIIDDVEDAHEGDVAENVAEDVESDSEEVVAGEGSEEEPDEDELAEEREPEEDDEDDGEEDEEDGLLPSYESLPDGTFRCLECARQGDDKILKTEKGMLDHIAQKH